MRTIEPVAAPTRPLGSGPSATRRRAAGPRRPLLGAVLSFAVAAAAAAQVDGRPPTDRDDAWVVLQGTSTDGRLDPVRLALVEQWIGRIRARHPEVASIHARMPHVPGEAIVFFTAAAKPKIASLAWSDDGGARMQPEVTGLRELDALQRELGARLQRHDMLLPGEEPLYVAHFAPELDAVAVERRYAALDVVEDAGPDVAMGDGDEIVLKTRGDRLLFVWKHGDGDCLAGCVVRHYFYFEVDVRAGTTQKRGELRWPEEMAPKVNLWGVPARWAVGVFADFDAVLAATANDDWWVALHGVEVIGHLLAGARSPYVGEDGEHVAEFERVRDQLAARPGAARRALVVSLAHRDPDVAAAALKWLRQVSKLDHGGDEAGQRAWAEWLERQRLAK